MLIAFPQVVFAHEHGDDASDHDSGHEHQHSEIEARFHIRLTGDQQVPVVNTTAFGFATVRLIDNTTLQFRVVVCDISNVILSHIHAGAAGANGPIVIHFFDQPSSPFSSPDGCATLVQGTRGPSDLVPNANAGINNWNDFVHALLAGNTYVNVHTTAHPGGELRGQIVSEHETGEEGED